VNDATHILGRQRIVQVAVHPMDRALAAPVGANLLDLLRDHQLPVSYSCRDGRCGTCRCRLVAGELIESGRASGQSPADDAHYVLACQATLVENCVIELPEPEEVVVHPPRCIKAMVVRLEETARDVRRMWLRPAKSFAYSPGQYAMLGFGPDHVRPYSMAGLGDDGELEFHVHHEPGGRVTRYIAETLALGDTVRLTGPLGTAYLRRKHCGPMLCIAGGTGLAPILSIVRGALAAGMTNPIHVYYGSAGTADLYGVEWVEELANRHANLKLHLVANGVNPRYRRGLLTDAVAADFKSLAGWRAYLAGNPAMVEAATLLAKRIGIDPGHIHAEAFHPSGA
jgi:naphthalene 1,2-dioxygenase ferredoxin reductase component